MGFLKDKKVAISMRNYIREMIADFGEIMPTVVASQAAKWSLYKDAKTRKLA